MYKLFLVLSIWQTIPTGGITKSVFRNKVILDQLNDSNIEIVDDQFMVYFSTSCRKEMTSQNRDIIQEFENEYQCYHRNVQITKTFEDIGDYWIVMEKQNNCDNENDKEIEWDDFCIVYSEYMTISTLSINQCMTRSVENALWNLDSAFPWQTNKVEYIEYESTYNAQMDIIVMDSGIDASHSEFNGITVERIHDAWPGQSLGSHGTHVAGTIVGENYGVFRAKDTQIKLVDVRIFPTSGGISTNVVLNGYDAIIDYLNNNCPKKAIINMSFGGGNSLEKNQRLEMIRSKGGIIIASAGNDNLDASNKSPASSPDTITIGNHDQNNKRIHATCRRWDGTRWINYDCSSNYGDLVDIWAPGTDIKSAIVGGGTDVCGTSMASPFVAGLAANLLANNPDLEFEDIKRQLINNAVWDVNDRLGNVDLPRVQISCGEYCSATEEPDHASNYPSMNCWQSDYVNDWDLGMNAYNDQYVFFNGIYSYHEDWRGDRRYKFRYCKPSDLTMTTAGSINLPTTIYDEEWERGCGGNSALSQAISHHDNGKEDRQWVFRCTPLPQFYRITDCEWTGYMNEWDGIMNYDCPNDGLLRTIQSYHDNSKEDRRFRFECCRVIENSYSYPTMTSIKDTNFVAAWDHTGQRNLTGMKDIKSSFI